MAILTLAGAALASALKKSKAAIAEFFPKAAGEVVKVGQGRPIESQVGRYADEYLRKFPAFVRAKIANNPVEVAALIDLLVENRRELTKEEAHYIANGRDAQVMGTLDGEPCQSEINIPFPVMREEDQTLGEAFLEAFRDLEAAAQSYANKTRKTLYAIAERYACERNLRNENLAKEYGAPLTAVGVMSKNIGCITLTDNAGKLPHGAVARMATFTPEPRKRKAAAVAPEAVAVHA